MANARQFLAARTAAWAKTGGWANPYITDGLVAMWDGEWNAGGGVHEPSANTWIEIMTGRAYTLPVNSYFDSTRKECYINGNDGNVIYVQKDDFNIASVVHVEYVATTEEHGRYGRLFGVTASNNWCFFSANTTSESNAGAISFMRKGQINWSLTGHHFVRQAISQRFNSSANKAAWLNGVKTTTTTYNSINFSQSVTAMKWCIGASLSGSTIEPGCNARINSIRLYSTALTDKQVAANYAIDKARFNLPD